MEVEQNYIVRLKYMKWIISSKFLFASTNLPALLLVNDVSSPNCAYPNPARVFRLQNGHVLETDHAPRRQYLTAPPLTTRSSIASTIWEFRGPSLSKRRRPEIYADTRPRAQVGRRPHVTPELSSGHRAFQVVAEAKCGVTKSGVGWSTGPLLDHRGVENLPPHPYSPRILKSISVTYPPTSQTINWLACSLRQLPLSRFNFLDTIIVAGQGHNVLSQHQIPSSHRLLAALRFLTLQSSFIGGLILLVLNAPAVTASSAEHIS
ncbi:uncharacterized protein CLUP02_00402 [Colletotrichum lupini]|uniref:Uncharacterized protein n=1 Tax=Colletotrichum lupini TaxID=145971 RepID=A0A9Q8SA79_9PEZI|nr:uncharacterized protein CLUP02_00402 [Colletotrichum lupini]UQC73756.1 hypothetical protein CLUP02_00402 [Colletotrichum lupini]